MKLLVTGGAGFIGSNFIRYMLSRYSEYSIINLDALTYAGNLANLKDIEEDPRYTFIQGDICDRALIDELMQKGIDVVVNFAAESHVDRSIANPDVFVQTNVMGVQVLLDAVRRYEPVKFVQISTDEVYGTLGEEGLFLETTPLAPNSPYSASKASGDLFVRAYHETYGLNVNITRCSNNYGPYQYTEKLIPMIIFKAYHDESIPVYGDGLNIRDWLFVEDHCSAIDLVIHHGVSGEIYNIGGNNERTNLEIVRTVLDHMNKPHSLISFVKDRPGHDRRYGIDATKIKNELGWKPKSDFSSGIGKTIEWYTENKDWWMKP